MSLLWLTSIAVIHHPLCIKDCAMSKLHSQQQKLLNADPSQALVPLCSTPRFPESATFSGSSLQCFYLPKPGSLSCWNGRGETLNIFQLFPSFLPSVPLFPSFFFCKILRASILHVLYRFSSFHSHPPCGCQVDSSLSGGSMFISQSGDGLSKPPRVRGTLHHFESGKVIGLKLARLLPHPFQFITLIILLFATTFWQC
jgi:hypothetical protein